MMTTNLIHLTAYADILFAKKIDALAATYGVSRSQIILAALEVQTDNQVFNPRPTSQRRDAIIHSGEFSGYCYVTENGTRQIGQVWLL